MITKDGQELHGNNAKEMVQELRFLSFSPGNTEAEFMAEVAERARLQTGQRVRTNTAENFIRDLQKAGLLSDENSG